MSGIGPEFAAGFPVQVPFVNQSKVTFPVGVTLVPDTVALSCTTDPTATEVTAV